MGEEQTGDPSDAAWVAACQKLRGGTFLAQYRSDPTRGVLGRLVEVDEYALRFVNCKVVTADTVAVSDASSILVPHTNVDCLQEVDGSTVYGTG